MLSATAVPWYPAPSAAAEAYPRTQLSAAAQAYRPNRPTTNTLARTAASEAVCAAGVIRTPEAECWVPGPGILFSKPCADDTREEEYEGPEPTRLLSISYAVFCLKKKKTNKKKKKKKKNKKKNNKKKQKTNNKKNKKTKSKAIRK